MKTICTLIAMALLGATAQARIGETEKQVEVRYGKPLESLRKEAVNARRYSFRGFTILVSFEGGVSASEIYQKNPPGPMTATEIMGLLDANGAGTKWHEPQRDGVQFFYLEKKRIAIYNAVSNELFVALPQFLDRFSARQSGFDATKMKDF
jgi:hypothetical protein